MIEIMKKCYICSEKSTKKITYSDSMGKKCIEYRCDVCAKQLESNESNTIHDIVKHKKSNKSTINTGQYRGKIHNQYSQHPDLIKSNNILI